VKYLGIVDGTMGILSRKMALQNTFLENQTVGVSMVKRPPAVGRRKASMIVKSNVNM
jgi:hypothetical protein